MTISKRFLSVIALVLFLVFVCPLYILPVSAATDDTPVFELDIGTPSISDNNGYIEILFYNNSNGEYFVRTYTWFTNAIGNCVDQTFCEITWGDDYVSLSPGFHIYDNSNIANDTVGARLNYFWCSSSGYTASSAINQYYNGNSNALKIESDNCVVKGVHVYGNYKLLKGSTTRNEFKVIYTNDNVAFNQLVEISQILSNILLNDLDSYIVLEDILTSNESISSKLSSVVHYLGVIDTGIDEVNYKLDRVIENTDDLEEKLDKIIEILESNIDVDVPSDVSKDSLNQHNSNESNIRDNLTNNKYDDVEDFDFGLDILNGESFQLCWQLIEMGLGTHEIIIVIVGIVIVLGLIALILNR